MGAKGSKGRPKTEIAATGGNQVRQAVDPNSYLGEKVTFIFHSFDVDGPWGLCAFGDCDWREVSKKIESLQGMMWREVLAADGAVKNGNNNHAIEVHKLSKAAQGRLNDIELSEDSLFSFHLTGRLRIYGVRDRKVCRLLWTDPWHNDPDRAVCVSQKRHT
jgi:hypothetical protein